MEWTARGPTQQRVEIVPPRASLDHVVNGCEALSRQSPAGIRRDLDRSENGKGKPIPPQGQKEKREKVTATKSGEGG